jgi:hypothetical protein
MQILIVFSFYFLILFSIIGYGNIFSHLLKRSLSFSELGFYGLTLLILISYISNFFVAHDYLHNVLLFFVGIISFLFFIFKKNFDRKFLILTLVIFLILFIGILIHKNHDDFFYYHFPYTISLIEQKKIIGLGHLEHGFRTPSSIFYLNSLFYLPIAKLSLINIGAIYYMGFANIFFLEKIFYYLKKKQTNFILFLSLVSLLIINTAFYRIAEHGTDRSALILIFVLVLTYFKSLEYSKILDRKKLLISYENILVLLLLIISLKSFYLIYVTILLVWLIQFRSILFEQNLFIDLLKNKITYLFILGLFIFVLTVFLNTSCLVYPASFTCFDSLEWSIPIQQVEAMKDWYSLWSKAGANPNFRTADPELYLSNFNWFINWIKTYFFTKMSDYLVVIIFISTICYFFLKNQKEKKIRNSDKINKIFYIFIILLFVEWFLNHPSLRYGGYTVVALLVFIPLCTHLSNYSIYNERLKKIVIFLIVLPLIIFFIKNIIRINSEIIKYNYKPLQNPHYHIVDNAYYFNKKLKHYDEVRKKTDKRYYLILSIPFINANK